MPTWWLEAVQARKAGRTQEQLAELVLARFKWKPSVPQVSRCLSGEVTSLELVDALSSVLGVPPPVIIAKSWTEALAIDARLELHRLDEERAKVGSVVKKSVNHPAGAAIPDADESSIGGADDHRGGRVGKGRGRTPPR